MEFKDEKEFDAAAEAWMEKNYPAGTECALDNNICECESYTIGEKRCSCGNRRISAFAEYFGDGFYLTLEAY
jgi:hypothetical protein